LSSLYRKLEELEEHKLQMEGSNYTNEVRRD